LVASGQLGIADGSLVHGGVVAETRQALSNLAGLLSEEGATMAQVVKTTVFLRHITDYPAMNEAYVAAFGGHRPARSAVAVAAIPLDALVEIEAWIWAG